MLMLAKAYISFMLFIRETFISPAPEGALIEKRAISLSTTQSMTRDININPSENSQGTDILSTKKFNRRSRKNLPGRILYRSFRLSDQIPQATVFVILYQTLPKAHYIFALYRDGMSQVPILPGEAIQRH